MSFGPNRVTGFCPKQGMYFKNFFDPKQGEGFKPSVTHLYQNIGQMEGR